MRHFPSYLDTCKSALKDSRRLTSRAKALEKDPGSSPGQALPGCQVTAVSAGAPLVSENKIKHPGGMNERSYMQHLPPYLAHHILRKH